MAMASRRTLHHLRQVFFTLLVASFTACLLTVSSPRLTTRVQERSGATKFHFGIAPSLEIDTPIIKSQPTLPNNGSELTGTSTAVTNETIPSVNRTLITKNILTLTSTARKPNKTILPSNVISQLDVGQGSNLKAPFKGENITKSSLTEKLWYFESAEVQQLYLFEHLLRKEWSGNRTHLERLRNELSNSHPYLGDKSLFILHQNSTKAGTKLTYGNGKANNANRTIPAEVYRRLPKKSPFSSSTKRFKTCAVVGNSGSLLNSSCGEMIDKADYVYRCNFVPLAEFKSDAGRKSNLTTMNPSIVTRDYKSFKSRLSKKKFMADINQYNDLLWIPCFFSQITSITTIRVVRLYKKNNPLVVCGDPQHFKAVRDFWNDKGLTKMISTGFYLVSTAIQFCDEIHLYGFWPFSARYAEKVIDVPYHYFDKLKQTSSHSMNKEFSILMQLHNLGVVHLHTGACT